MAENCQSVTEFLLDNTQMMFCGIGIETGADVSYGAYG
jgi:hypothetical protein